MAGDGVVDFTRWHGPLSPECSAAIDDAFDYQPWDADQVSAGVKVRRALADAVRTVVEFAPPCPDRSVAIRKLREARMDANSAITHRGRL